ncbi:stage VI sporulation protein D [Bacillus sp. FJAT-27225]|uniref:stage VI sporulation protein D n=1 Tax=Bacillus sp. FJAT-27225 TaxID=1743144 RepID=UPI00080C2F2A|nr:stage VI sporulation protein D [Bacillus sp. FJAT-27225]OCA91274.1 stage VI sporulation protein D [Bacillus sp. FJAT-27225]
MSQENQSSLRFSLEESLWFRKGQEVDELVSISLSPDITIQETDGYINIRGALDLTGEYVCNGDGSVEADEAGPALRYVQSAVLREEGLWDFAHRFPVDITIPVNRIESIYDIDVIVDSFDYSFSERSCMKLTADLIISGLYAGEPEVKEEPEEIFLGVQEREYEAEEELEEDYEEVEIEQREEEEELVFEAEARRMPEDNPDELATFSAFPFNPSFASYWNQSQTVSKRAEQQPPVQQYQQVRQQQPQAQAPNQSEAQYEQAEQPYASEQYGDVQELEAVQTHQVELESAGEVETIEVAAQEQTEDPVAEAEETVEVAAAPAQKKKTKKTSMSLTEFFARRDEHEEQAKLKVCIVQKGESLDSLSDRYNVSVQNILRYNNLEISQDVYEGQVLYIPAAFAKK